MLNIHSILVAVDFTPCSANALREAMRLAALTSASVRVVHVIDTLVVIDLERSLSPYQQAIEARLREQAEASWKAFIADAVPEGATLPFDVYVTNRVAGILAAAATHRADLLVLGAFGHRRPDVGIGTIASGCVRRSPIDVLLVRDTHSGPSTGIVASVDFSEPSQRALDWAARIAAMDGAELHVLHVFDPPWNYASLAFPSDPILPAVHMPGRAEMQAASEAQLASLAAELKAKFPALRVITSCYDKAGYRSGISDYAAAVGADLVTLGTRGRSNLRDMFLGSTAEKTLQSSTCSVLAVKPRVE